MNNITMTAPKTSMPVWFARLQEIATSKGWNIENPEEWEPYYNKGYTPEEAFDFEMEYRPQ